MDISSNLIEDPITGLKDIFDSCEHITLGYNEDAMDEAQAIMQARGYKIAAVIGSQQTLKDVLVDFCFSFDGDFYIGKSNEIMINVLDCSPQVSVKAFTEDQVLEFKLEELPEEIRNNVQYPYKYNHALEKYENSPVFINKSSINNWGDFYNEKNESLNLKYVYDSVTADDVVQRYAIQRKNPRRKADFSAPLSVFDGLDISDVVEIQHPNAISSDPRKYQIRRVNIDFNTDTVQAEAFDIEAFSSGLFILGDREEVPAVLSEFWSSTDEYSRKYGYLADRNTGYFNNSTDYGKVLY
jgi:hypothetical protein